MQLIPRITLIVLIVIAAVVTIMSVIAPDIKDDPSGNMHNPILYASYTYSILAAVAVAAAVVFTLVKNPGNIVRMAIGLALFGAIIGICYGLGDGSDFASFKQEGLTESVSRWSGASLYAVYILGALGILSIAFSSVYKLVK